MFEQLLRDDVYCAVPEALSQIYGVLAAPTLTVGEAAHPIVGAYFK